MPAAPFSNFQYLVEIDGSTQAGFTEVTGISAEVESIEYREGGDKGFTRKVPGLVKFPNVTLKRGIVDIHLWQWMRTVLTGATQKSQVAIVLLDESKQPVARFTLRNAWPRKWEGPALSAKGTDIAIESLEIVHEELNIEFL